MAEEKSLFDKTTLLRTAGGFRTSLLGVPGFHQSDPPFSCWKAVVGTPSLDLAYSSMWTVPKGSYACFVAPYARLNYEFCQEWQPKIARYYMDSDLWRTLDMLFNTYTGQPSSRFQRYIQRLKEDLDFPSEIPFEYTYPPTYMDESFFSADNVLIWWLSSYAQPSLTYANQGRCGTMFVGRPSGTIDVNYIAPSLLPCCIYHTMCFYVFTMDGMPICGMPAGAFTDYMQEEELPKFSMLVNFPEVLDWSVINRNETINYIKYNDRDPLKLFRYKSNLIRWSGTFVDKDCTGYLRDTRTYDKGLPYENSKRLGTWSEFSYHIEISATGMAIEGLNSVILDAPMLDLSLGRGCPGQILEVHAQSEDLLVGFFTTDGGVVYGTNGCINSRPQVHRYNGMTCARPIFERWRRPRAVPVKPDVEVQPEGYDGLGNSVRHYIDDSLRFRYVK